MDVRTCLWFDGRIEEAAAFYASLVPGSQIESVTHFPPNNAFPVGKPGDALTVEMLIGGAPFQLLNGGPRFPQSEAVSISLVVDGQAEVDRLWEALTAAGGEESECGWCKDRFGLSWQIVPRRYLELAEGPNAAAVNEAMMRMRKLDIAALETAASS